MGPHLQIILYMTMSRWYWTCEDIDDPETAVEGHAHDYETACRDAHRAHDEMRGKLVP